MVVLEDSVQNTTQSVFGRVYLAVMFQSHSLDVFVQGRLENKVGREELEDGKITSLERECAGVKSNRNIDRFKTQHVPNAMECIALDRSINIRS
jgi:hypothetical protein